MKQSAEFENTKKLLCSFLTPQALAANLSPQGSTRYEMLDLSGASQQKVLHTYYQTANQIVTDVQI